MHFWYVKSNALKISQAKVRKFVRVSIRWVMEARYVKENRKRT